MKSTPLMATIAMVALGACAQTASVPGRAANDMLHFSAKNPAYVLPVSTER